VWASSGETAGDGDAPGGETGAAIAEARRLFSEAMDDDFNTAKAIGHLFDYARVVNRLLDEGAGREALAAARVLHELGGVLGLFWKAPAAEQWDAEVLGLVEAREQARRSKDWASADRIRGELFERGVVVEDGPAGPKVKRR
jgi:cysteinyl-tRNA synthetase